MSDTYSPNLISSLSININKPENVYATWPKEKNLWGSSSYPPMPTSPPPQLRPRPQLHLRMDENYPPALIKRIKKELLPIINRSNKPGVIVFKGGYIEKSY
jgi:hypothetical protein